MRGGVALLLVVARFLGTKIVPAGSSLGGTAGSFDAASYGKKQFPIQQKYVQSHAVAVAVAAFAALMADQAAAAKKCGVSVDFGTSTIVCVKLTGVGGTVPAAGFTPVTASGLPADLALAADVGTTGKYSQLLGLPPTTTQPLARRVTAPCSRSTRV